MASSFSLAVKSVERLGPHNDPSDAESLPKQVTGYPPTFCSPVSLLKEGGAWAIECPQPDSDKAIFLQLVRNDYQARDWAANCTRRIGSLVNFILAIRGGFFNKQRFRNGAWYGGIDLLKTQQIAEEKRGVAETEKIARQTEEIKMVAMAWNIVNPAPGTFMNAVWALPAMQDWTEKARAEP